uniref:Uncharacterized protein n=1 Tax=Odontella aurita TaxID=265563 RepID=A0A7S4M722_9STRA|mmetsp:Transcript_12615/g.37206  ORF Transcript_12615/g.37206 Transcript_12615/m.37206 type:complete len:134 (+) Transcript_12615:1105-1506(+)
MAPESERVRTPQVKVKEYSKSLSSNRCANALLFSPSADTVSSQGRRTCIRWRLRSFYFMPEGCWMKNLLTRESNRFDGTVVAGKLSDGGVPRKGRRRRWHLSDVLIPTSDRDRPAEAAAPPISAYHRKVMLAN